MMQYPDNTEEAISFAKNTLFTHFYLHITVTTVTNSEQASVNSDQRNCSNC